MELDTDLLAVFLYWVLGVLGAAAAFVWLAYKLKILRVITVEEATAVAFKHMGRGCYVAMEFTSHHFGPRGFICNNARPEDQGWNSVGRCWCIWRIGGWIYYLHPFVKVASYGECNAKYTDSQGKEKFGDGIYIRLVPVIIEPTVSVQKTAQPENVSLSILFIATLRIVNPFLDMFASPYDIIQVAISRIDTALRAWVSHNYQNYVQLTEGSGEDLWQDLVDLGIMPIFDELKDKWGVEIVPNSILIKGVRYTDPKYQESLDAAAVAELLAKAKLVMITVADRAMDRWVKVQARRMGLSVADALVALKANGDWARQSDKYMAQIMADNAELLLIGNPDGTKMEGGLAPAIALFRAASDRLGKGNRRKDNRGKNSGEGDKERRSVQKQREMVEDIKKQLGG